MTRKSGAIADRFPECVRVPTTRGVISQQDSLHTRCSLAAEQEWKWIESSNWNDLDAKCWTSRWQGSTTTNRRDKSRSTTTGKWNLPDLGQTDKMTQNEIIMPKWCNWAKKSSSYNYTKLRPTRPRRNKFAVLQLNMASMHKIEMSPALNGGINGQIKR